MVRNCPPFCSSDCHVIHDSLLVKLLSVQEGNPVTLDAFEEEAERQFKAGLQPEDPIDDPSPEYRYPILHWSVVLGKFSVVEFLIEKGHSPCIQSREKSETPLHRAVHCLVLGLKNLSDSHRFKRFKQILDLLAPAVGMQDDNGDTPVHLCAKYITEYYLQNYLNYYKEAMESMINVVVCTNQTDAFDTQNKDGNTLLHIFAQTHNELCFTFAKKLLKLGAAVNIRNNLGQYCTDIARKCSYKLFMYVDSRKRKLKKKNFRKHSRSDAEGGDSDMNFIAPKRLRASRESSPVQGPSSCTIVKPQLVPTFTKDTSISEVQCIPTPINGRWQENNLSGSTLSERDSQETKAGLKLPHTPPHMPGDLEQDDEDHTELKFELVGDLFNELSNCTSGTANTSILQSKGGVLKDLLRRSGQILTWINETRKIVSEKSKELEDQRSAYRGIIQEIGEHNDKQRNLETAIELKRKELDSLEEGLKRTQLKTAKLETDSKEQKESIEKSEQLITTLGQIVAILEND